MNKKKEPSGLNEPEDILWDSESEEKEVVQEESSYPFSQKEKKEKKKSAYKVFLIAPTYILIEKDGETLKKIQGKWEGLKVGDTYYD